MGNLLVFAVFWCFFHSLFCNIVVLQLVMSKQYVAYKGEAFQIEWYYDSRGSSQAMDYYAELDVEDRIKVMKLFKMMGDVGRIGDITKFRSEGDKVYAFKPQPHRFLSFLYRAKRLLSPMLSGRNKINFLRAKKTGRLSVWIHISSV